MTRILISALVLMFLCGLSFYATVKWADHQTYKQEFAP